jgi:hypothetical protein
LPATLNLSVNTVSVHRANIMNTLGLHKTAELVVYALQHGLVIAAMNRREFLIATAGAAAATAAWPNTVTAQAQPSFRLVDVTAARVCCSSINNGAIRSKLLPETLGSGAPFWTTTATAGRTSCSSTAWTGRAMRDGRSTLALFRNNRNGTFPT